MDDQFEIDRLKFEKAKRNLLDASEMTSSECPKLHQAILEKVGVYIADPRGATMIKAAAGDIGRLLALFHSLEVDLLSECGQVSGRSHDKVIASGLEEMRRLLTDLDRSNRQFDLIAIARMRAVSSIFAIATDISVLHIATLENALGIQQHNLTSLAQRIALHIKELVKNFGKDGIIDLINTAAPGTGPLIRVLNILSETQDRLNRTPLDYRQANAETGIANLAEALALQNDVMKLEIEALRAGEFP